MYYENLNFVMFMILGRQKLIETCLCRQNVAKGIANFLCNLVMILFFCKKRI